MCITTSSKSDLLHIGFTFVLSKFQTHPFFLKSFLNSRRCYLLCLADGTLMANVPVIYIFTYLPGCVWVGGGVVMLFGMVSLHH